LWSASSQAVWAQASGGSLRALLVSPFNVKWRCYVQAGGVEESKFCLFLVVFPVRCISSVSGDFTLGRFYFRKYAFCFLPLVAILESNPAGNILRAIKSQYMEGIEERGVNKIKSNQQRSSVSPGNSVSLDREQFLGGKIPGKFQK
jgi:hypothetical protein